MIRSAVSVLLTIKTTWLRPFINIQLPSMINFFLSRLKAIGYAVEGWWYVIRSQKNAWIHALASISVILLGLWLQLPRQEWTIILLTITIVWIVEFINTALEVLTDLISPQYNHLAKKTKDIGAAAVLIAAGASVIVGILILGPPLWQKMKILIAN